MFSMVEVSLVVCFRPEVVWKVNKSTLLVGAVNNKLFALDFNYTHIFFCPEDAEISSTLKWLMNRSRIWSSGRNFRMIISVSFLSMSPTNIYLMWYLKIKENYHSTDSEFMQKFYTYNKSQIESIYLSGAGPWFLSICSNNSYKRFVKSYPRRGRSWSSRNMNGPNKWHT